VRRAHRARGVAVVVAALLLAAPGGARAESRTAAQDSPLPFVFGSNVY
jgi:hypothetical protein